MQALVHFLKWRIGLDVADRWMRPDEGACLLEYAKGKTRLAEVGVWEGGTTRLLREVMAPGGVIFAIDPHAPGRIGISYQQLIAHAEVGRVRNGRVQWLRTTSAEAVRNPDVLATPFDFVFVDGEHTYEAMREDWAGWSPLVAAGGILALHDTVQPEGQPGCGSIDFANDVILHDARFEILDEVWALRVLRRRA